MRPRECSSREVTSPPSLSQRGGGDQRQHRSPAVTRSVPIAITGMHRSGTSMITRALHDSGLHLVGPAPRS